MYKDGKRYKQAIAYTLALDYGTQDIYKTWFSYAKF